FSPGLVGGHCIGVDPYYLTYKAEQMGYQSQVILSGRRINDGMGKYVAENTIKQLIKADINIHDAKIGILGFSFKENVPDTRNSRVIDIIHELEEYDVTPLVYDPVADQKEAKQEYGIYMNTFDEMKDLDAIILAVEHEEFKNLTKEEFENMYKSGLN